MIPAIYHLEAKVITRGIGRSAVAASAYMSCSEITNEYDGVKHDYTRKGGLVYERIFLPSHAPPEWCDRSKLWNAVEEAEKTRDSRLAREFIVALPVEVSRERQIAEAEEFAKALVEDGMCVDVCIHDTGEGNPHAHIMATVRPLNPDGTWQRKTEKEYLCIRDGKEQGFTASEFLSAKNEGWEKQYQFFVDGKKVYLPPSAALGYERVNKYPKSTKYGRQNPISERWNSDEQLCEWRKLWADIVNRDLAEKNIEPIDHRSFVARGILLQPTIHEGVSSKKMKKKGKVTERMRINILIRKDNSLILSLRKTVKALTELVVTAAKLLLPALADALEGIRVSMIILECERKSIMRTKNEAINAVRDADEFYVAFQKLQEDIKTTETKLKEAKKKLKISPKVMKQKYNEAKCDVNHYEFELKELTFKMQNILAQNDCKTEQEIFDTKPYFEKKRKFEIPKLEAEEKRMEAEIQKILTQYQETEKQADEADAEELKTERMKIRPEKETEARLTVETKLCDISEYDFNRSVDTVSDLIGEPPPHYLTKSEIAQQEEYDRLVKQQEERRRQMEERRKARNNQNIKNKNERSR
ncbi:MAG: MobQ family relaxase [Candidatus Fimenecus sp.]